MNFNLTDPIQFPKLAGIKNNLSAFINTKQTGIYRFRSKCYHEWQDPYRVQTVVSDEEREQDIRTVIAELKNQLINASYSSYINELIYERDGYFAINISIDKDFERNIATYNRFVIGEMEALFNWIYGLMHDIFYTHFNEVHKEDLRAKSIFQKWYDEFGIKKQSGSNPESTNFTENKFNPSVKSVQQVTDFFTRELMHYAEEDTIKEFLYSAFQLCEKPKQKFSFQEINCEKNEIMKVFKKFYNDCGKIHGKANKYAGLLGDYFIGFETSNVAKNW